MTDTTNPHKSMKQLAVEALLVQDACNLSGVLHGASNAVTDLIANLRESGEYTGTDQINKHPIMVLWSSKITSLTSSESYGVFDKAYDAVEELAK